MVNELDSWINSDIEIDRLKHLVEKYVTYMEEIVTESHGKTVQFWINHAYLMDMCVILYLAMKMNDIQLFAYVFYQINSVFFSINYPNYAMMTLDDTLFVGTDELVFA